VEEGRASWNSASSEERRLAALESRAEALLACGRHRELIGELETLIDGHPLRERPWSYLMLALYRAGRQADALRAYRDLRAILVRELGIEPSHALREYA
jgi:DNA-binding SARP family transcriptional activator